ncbi:hypothetical protein C3F09_01930 [candidate division GN15 bacterium]|uniref:DinB-like domain-containing protein n=1 Tax=candidate division GN15 bacterium TaxID=2072418 RepID=A0A855X6K0_9BACT|nr:MAG: hypothetical protein C3F09_01930 [candidate division GN15 bacterium]
MSSFRVGRPGADEYAPYYDKYIARVPDGDILVTLANQLDATLALIRSLSEQQAMFAYAAGKWSVKEVIGHVIDCERVFAYRALRIARGDQTPLASISENDFAKHGGQAARSTADLAEEFQHLRVSSLDLLRSFDTAAWDRRGTASNNPVSVRALAWILAGHELHHRTIIHERYLV